MMYMNNYASRTAIVVCAALVPLLAVAACDPDSTGAPVGIDAGGSSTSGGGSSSSTSSGSSGMPMDGGSTSPTCDLTVEKLCGGICVKKDDPSYGCSPDGCASCAEAPNVGKFRCEANTCKVGTCLPGKLDCDGVGGNGCETDGLTAKNCGACGKLCVTNAPNCVESTPAGDAGAADGGAVASAECTITCSGRAPDICGNTCTNLARDPQNCKSCGTVCPAPMKGVGVCSQSTCIQSCYAGMKVDPIKDTCVTDPLTCNGAGVIVNQSEQCCSRQVDANSACTRCGVPNAKCAAGPCCAGLTCKMGICSL
jgi:hypothetical protein